MAKVLIGNIKGPKGEQGPQGIQGIPGPAGADGEIDSNSLIEFEDYEGEGAPQLPSLEESLGKIESNISIGKWMSYVKAFNMNVSNFLKGVVTLGKLANNLTTTEEGFALDARQGSIIAAKNAQLENAIEELNSNIAIKFGNITPIASAFTMSGGTLQKSGNVKRIVFAGQVTAQRAIYTMIARVPLAYTPQNRAITKAVWLNNLIIGYINFTNGEIKIQPTEELNNITIYIDETYI